MADGADQKFWVDGQPYEYIITPADSTGGSNTFWANGSPYPLLAAAPAPAGNSSTTAATNYPSSASVTQVNDMSWTNLSNAFANDGVAATISEPGDGSFVGDYVKFSGFGFSIPSTATISKITINTRQKADNLAGQAYITDDQVYLLNGNTQVGNNLAINGGGLYDTPQTIYQMTYQNTSYVSQTGDAGFTTWTPAVVNASTFGVFYSVSAFDMGGGNTGYLDYINVEVTYTTEGGTTTTAQSSPQQIFAALFM